VVPVAAAVAGGGVGLVALGAYMYRRRSKAGHTGVRPASRNAQELAMFTNPLRQDSASVPRTDAAPLYVNWMGNESSTDAHLDLNEPAQLATHGYLDVLPEASVSPDGDIPPPLPGAPLNGRLRSNSVYGVRRGSVGSPGSAEDIFGIERLVENPALPPASFYGAIRIYESIATDEQGAPTTTAAYTSANDHAAPVQRKAASGSASASAGDYFEPVIAVKASAHPTGSDSAAAPPKRTAPYQNVDIRANASPASHAAPLVQPPMHASTSFQQPEPATLQFNPVTDDDGPAMHAQSVRGEVFTGDLYTIPSRSRTTSDAAPPIRRQAYENQAMFASTNSSTVSHTSQPQEPVIYGVHGDESSDTDGGGSKPAQLALINSYGDRSTDPERDATPAHTGAKGRATVATLPTQRSAQIEFHSNESRDHDDHYGMRPAATILASINEVYGIASPADQATSDVSSRASAAVTAFEPEDSYDFKEPVNTLVAYPTVRAGASAKRDPYHRLEHTSHAGTIYDSPLDDGSRTIRLGSVSLGESIYGVAGAAPLHVPPASAARDSTRVVTLLPDKGAYENILSPK
jgi:hypothetical protein